MNKSKCYLRWESFIDQYVAYDYSKLGSGCIGWFDTLEDAEKTLNNMGYDPILTE